MEKPSSTSPSSSQSLGEFDCEIKKWDNKSIVLYVYYFYYKYLHQIDTKPTIIKSWLIILQFHTIYVSSERVKWKLCLIEIISSYNHEFWFDIIMIQKCRESKRDV